MLSNRNASFPIACCATLIVLLGGAPSVAAPVTEVPFRYDAAGHVVVDVHVDGGEPLPFVVDTGAGRTVLNSGRLDALRVHERETADARAQGAHGTHRLGGAHLESLRLGDLAIEDLDVVTMDLSHVEPAGEPSYGIVGVDVLGRYDLRIDFENRTVSFHPRSTAGEPCEVCTGTIQASFEMAQGTHVVFDVGIGDVAIPTILDTGSGRSGMNRAAARAIGVDLAPFDEEPLKAGAGHHGPVLQVGELRVGDAVLATDQHVGVVDLPVFGAFGLEDSPAMLLGTGALQGRVLGLAYGQRRLYVR
jgi:predicted aspartyl protease